MPRRSMRVATFAVRAIALSALPSALLAAQLVAQQADLAPRVDRIFARFTPSTPGCAVGLAKDDRTLYSRGYGSANLEYGVPLTDSTVLESGSVAKQFTASAMVLLQQDGKLSLDDDIRKYLPEVPDFGQKISIRNLLTHTSGLRDQWGLLGIEGRGPGSQVHSTATTLDLVVHQKMLNFPTGREYLYSNTGYALAAVIVERVSGQSLQAFTQARLFRPLGMTHTQWRDDFTRVVPNRATAYAPVNDGFRQDMPFTNMIGNGGLLSTMSDLLKWNANLDHPAVGGPAYVEAMQTRMHLTNGRTITYALGLEVADYHGTREVSHSGSTAGYRTYLGRFPDQKVSVAVWCNHAGANPVALGHQVADLVLTMDPISAGEARAAHVDVPAGAIARWEGLYRDRHTDQSLTLAATASALTSQAGARTISWLPLDAARFRSELGAMTLTGSAGNRVGILVRANGDSSRFEEVRAPSKLTVSDYTGVYVSDELDTRLTIAARNGKLFVERRPADSFELTPAYADDFQSGGDLGTIRFARDASGKVTGFAIFAGRVLDVRFTRAR